MPAGGERQACLTADYNAEMLEHRERFPWVRDRSVFVGTPDDVVPDSFGPGLPSIRQWTRGRVRVRRLRQRATRRPPTRSGPAAGVAGLARRPDRVRRRGGRHGRRGRPAAAGARRGAGGPTRAGRTCGSSWWRGHGSTRASLPRRRGATVLGYVPDLWRQLAACDVAVVQGGLTTCMELTAAAAPVPLRAAAQPLRAEPARAAPAGALRRRARTCPTSSSSTPTRSGPSCSPTLARPVTSAPVETDGAARAARLLADLL